MFKGVIFDIDCTLYDYTKHDKTAVQNICNYVEKNLGVDEKRFRAVYTEARNIVRRRLPDGGSRHSRVLLFQTALELLGENPFHYVLDMYDIYWNDFLFGMQPFDGAFEFIRKLKDYGVKIALCTDMTAHIQYRKIERLGLTDYVDFMVASEETGFDKPSPLMFELALSKLNITPAEAAYFGDSLERDIEGAANAGITPFWYIGDRVVGDTDIDCVKVRSYRDLIDSEKFFGGE